MIDAPSLWTLAERLRERSPLVQCITNFVAMDVTANVLLAIGASPAMVHDATESGEFVGLGGTLSINIGTPSPRWTEGMLAAATAADTRETPWVLDPVAVGATRYRTGLAASLLPLHPAIIRGNAGEIMSLAGEERVEITGPDSSRSSNDAHAAARSLASRQNATVVVTGAEDVITDGARMVLLRNGHPLMTKVTALGCALTAVNAAYLAVADTPFAAAAAATAYYGVCGELAAENTTGPGSFRASFIDILFSLDRETFLSRIKITTRDVET